MNMYSRHPHLFLIFQLIKLNYVIFEIATYTTQNSPFCKLQSRVHLSENVLVILILFNLQYLVHMILCLKKRYFNTT